MIRFESIYDCGDIRFVPPQWAYQIYSAVLEAFPTETAEKLHNGSDIGIHQFLVPYGPGRCRWVFNISGYEAEAEQAIEKLEQIEIRPQGIILKRTELTEKRVTVPELLSADIAPGSIAQIRFLTPTTFHTDGAYAIFPSVQLIIQSVMRRWKLFFPEFDLDDEDAKALLINSLWIADYDLASRRFPIKEGIIHGFTGRIDIRGRLSIPMVQLWNLICTAMPYMGLGTKSRLGMGAVSCEIYAPGEKRVHKVPKDGQPGV